MTVSRAFRLVILGAPGSGKGTISKRIIRDFELKYLSSGDLLRAQMIEKTDAGNEAKLYIEHGQLVPDELIIKLITNELNKMRGTSWLLDGFPRTATQAKALQKDEPVNLALNLDVPAAVIMDRIKGRWIHTPSGRIYHTDFNPPKVEKRDDVTGDRLQQREDDKAEVVRERLYSYSKNMKHVLEFYKDLEILQEFRGTESNEIWPRIRNYLTGFLHTK